MDCIVHLPIFADASSLQIRNVPYQVTSAQLHFGDRPTSGHYRAILRGQKEFGALQAWITDDNQVPQSATITHSEAVYLLWLRQVCETGEIE